MIAIIIFSCIGLTTALFLTGFTCYHIIKMSRLLTKLNRKLIQNDKITQVCSKKMSDLKTSLDEQFDALKVITKKSASPSSNAKFALKETIEQNYERAKNLIERGVLPSRELMESCNITEEELELLSGSLPE